MRKKLLAIFLLALTMLLITSGSFADRPSHTLSFSANSKTIKSGRLLVLRGRFLNGRKHPLSNRVVALQKRGTKLVTKKINGRLKKVKRHFWRKLKVRRTNRLGVYSLRFRPKKSATYRARARIRTRSGRKSLFSRKIRNTVLRIAKRKIIPSPIVTSTSPMNDRLGLAVGNKLVWLSDQELANQLDSIAALGIKWIRHDMSWDAIQSDNSTTYNWAPYDRLVSEANKRNIKILAILTYTPRWARIAAAIDTAKSAPANPDQFATYAANVARRYAPLGIHAFEIWNEPNHNYFWQPTPSVSAYTTLLKKSYVSIKQADPSATVISGGLSPATTIDGKISPRDFVAGMYANGAKNYFDVLGHHPYNALVLPSEFHEWSAWSQMSETSPSIRSIMTSYGDSNKPIWATEYGKPTNGPSSVSESFQAQAFQDAAKQMQYKPWLQKLFIYSYKDLGTDTNNRENFFGVLRYNGTFKPGYYSLKNILSN